MDTKSKGTKQKVFNYQTNVFKPVIKKIYYQLTNEKTEEELRQEFIQYFFNSKKEYNTYITEAKQGPLSYLYKEGIEEYQRLTNKKNLSGVGLDTALDYYALVRKLKPATITETGVCNGISALAVLLALTKNEQGTLYSIDYPFRVDESLDEFREETFEEYGGAAIPSNKDPGWIIPEELRSRWKLIIGKSQRKLPELLVKIKNIDMFLHDSEHSAPCMMFEYELAYEHLNNDGLILSDDITWNDSFSTFTDVRDGEYGYLRDNVGYIQKTE